MTKTVPAHNPDSVADGLTMAGFIGGSSRILGVFGYPVEHSLSPQMHNTALLHAGLPFVYVPFLVSPDSLEAALRALPLLGIVGVNLTIPHKERALAIVDEITDEAREVGAVNTVTCVGNRLVADNTDGRGFYRPLIETGFAPANSEAVVIGAGGAARSVIFTLARNQVNRITLVNRSLDRAVALADAVAAAGYPCRIDPINFDDRQLLAQRISGSPLLVNTTRAGMHPNEDQELPLPFESLHPDLLVYDLVYNPIETALLRRAAAVGCRTLTGVKMLVYQGAAAFERWTGVWPSTSLMETAVIRGLLR